MMLITQRDMVQKRKIWHPMPDNDSFLIFFYSVKHDKCPVLSKFVRAISLRSGYFIKTIQHDPPQSKIVSVSQSDFGGSLPRPLVVSMTSKAPKDWVLSLKKGLDKIKKEKNNEA